MFRILHEILVEERTSSHNVIRWLYMQHINSIFACLIEQQYKCTSFRIRQVSDLLIVRQVTLTKCHAFLNFTTLTSFIQSFALHSAYWNKL